MTIEQVRAISLEYAKGGQPVKPKLSRKAERRQKAREVLKSANAGTDIRKEEFAEALRHSPVRSEGILYNEVKWRYPDYRFLSNPVVFGFIPDIYSAKLQLIIEVDGGSHAGRETNDAERDAIFRRHGIVTVRISARRVMEDLTSVLRDVGVCVKARIEAIGLQEFNAAARPVPKPEDIQPWRKSRPSKAGDLCYKCKSPTIEKSRKGVIPKKRTPSGYYYERYLVCGNKSCKTMYMSDADKRLFLPASAL